MLSLYQSRSLLAQKEEMTLKAASDNLRGYGVNIARLRNELMGSFDLDNKTGV